MSVFIIHFSLSETENVISFLKTSCCGKVFDPKVRDNE